MTRQIWTPSMMATMASMRARGFNWWKISETMGCSVDACKSVSSARRETARLSLLNAQNKKPQAATGPERRVTCIAQLSEVCLGSFSTTEPSRNRVCRRCKKTHRWREGADATIEAREQWT